MTTTPAPTGAELRAEGVDAVLAADTAVHRGYAPLVREAVESLSDDFDAEDVRLWIDVVHPEVRPHSPNTLPATLGGLAHAGRIRAVGWRTATRPSSRQRTLRVWRRVTD